MMTNAFRLAAWALLALIVVVTIGPIGLRPVTGAPVSMERAFAFLAVGFVFAIAYPKHMGWVILLIIFATLGLEMLQNLRPDRHSGLLQAFVKLAGGTGGLWAGWLALKIWVAIKPTDDWANGSRPPSI